MGRHAPTIRPGSRPVSPALARRREAAALGLSRPAPNPMPPEGTPECEAYRERMRANGRKSSAKGIPQGWGGRVRELGQARERAREEATKIVRAAVEADTITPDVSDDDNARTALAYLVSVVIARGDDGSPVEKVADRIKAAGLVLAYTRARPAGRGPRGAEALSLAEAWLRAIAG